MPDEKRSARDGEQDGYLTDTFSRNDREGLPGPEVDMAGVSAVLSAGEEDGYATDTFSRNDREGTPTEEEATADDKPRKAADDPESRDATPPPIEKDGGGVR